jgi:regulator of sirC expression with transglutaminase-like and TPR domain
MQPAFAGAYLNRALVFIKTGVGDREQAILDLEQYLKLAPDATNKEQVQKVLEDLKSESAP